VRGCYGLTHRKGNPLRHGDPSGHNPPLIGALLFHTQNPPCDRLFNSPYLTTTMSKRRYLHRSRHVILKLDGTTEPVERRVKKGDESFVRAVKSLADVEGIAVKRLPTMDNLHRLRQTHRGPGSGATRNIGIRLKADAYESVERRADELGMNVSEYIRALILKDTGVVT